MRPTEAAGREALGIRERLFRADHPEVATSTSDLGLLLRRRGQFREAEARASSRSP
jgi:hypothetical protein